jgi:hypothetical protein
MQFIQLMIDKQIRINKGITDTPEQRAEVSREWF